MRQSVQQEKCVTVVVSDSKVVSKGLEKAGKDKIWLKKQLDLQGKKLENVFLAVCDSQGTFSAFEVSKK